MYQRSYRIVALLALVLSLCVVQRAGVIYNPVTGWSVSPATFPTQTHEWLLSEGTGQTAADTAGSRDCQLGSDPGSDANDPSWVTEGISFSSATGLSCSGSAFADFSSSAHTFCGTLMSTDYGDQQDWLTIGDVLNWVVGDEWRHWARTSSYFDIQSLPLNHLSTFDNTWFHHCIVMGVNPTGSNAEMYSDAIILDENIVADAYSGSSGGSTVVIGNRAVNNATLNWTGKIGTVRIWEEALTIYDIYQVCLADKAEMASRGVTINCVNPGPEPVHEWLLTSDLSTQPDSIGSSDCVEDPTAANQPTYISGGGYSLDGNDDWDCGSSVTKPAISAGWTACYILNQDAAAADVLGYQAASSGFVRIGTQAVSSEGDPEIVVRETATSNELVARNPLSVIGQSELICYTVPSLASDHAPSTWGYVNTARSAPSNTVNTWTTTPSWTGNFFMGAQDGSGTSGINGDLFRAAIWDQQLTPDEILTVCNSWNGHNGQSLVCSNPAIPAGETQSYHMNGGSGDAITDWSGNDNDAQRGETTGSDADDPTWTTISTDETYLDFDGGDEIEMPAFSDADEWTIGILWHSDVTPSGTSLLGNPGAGEKLLANTSSNFFVRIIDSGSSDTPTGVPANNTWQFITLRRDASNKVDMFLDDDVGPVRLFGDAAQSGTTQFSELGEAPGNSPLDGGIAFFIAYPEALTDAQIQDELYCAVAHLKPDIMPTPFCDVPTGTSQYLFLTDSTTETDQIGANDCTRGGGAARPNFIDPGYRYSGNDNFNCGQPAAFEPDLSDAYSVCAIFDIDITSSRSTLGMSGTSPEFAVYTSTELTTNVFNSTPDPDDELQVDGGTIGIEEWHHVCWTIPALASNHGSTSLIHLDGTSQGLTVDNNTWETGPTYTTDFLIGETNQSASVGHDGDLLMVEIWDGVQLTEGQAAAHCRKWDAYYLNLGAMPQPGSTPLACAAN